MYSLYIYIYIYIYIIIKKKRCVHFSRSILSALVRIPQSISNCFAVSVPRSAASLVFYQRVRSEQSCDGLRSETTSYSLNPKKTHAKRKLYKNLKRRVIGQVCARYFISEAAMEATLAGRAEYAGNTILHFLIVISIFDVVPVALKDGEL